MSQVFGVLFPVFSIILVGYLYGRWRPSDINTVNRMNIDVFIPALVIDSLMRSQFDLWSYRWLLLAGIGVVIFFRFGRLDNCLLAQTVLPCLCTHHDVQ